MISGRFGVWSIPLRTLPIDKANDLASRLGSAGFGTLWVPGGPEATLLRRLGELLDGARATSFASGVLVTWRHPVQEVAAWLRALDPRQRERFTLGIGISHRELAGRPLLAPVDQVTGYLAALRRSLDGTAPEIVLGALGPVMTRLGASITDGVHPYLVTVEHTRSVRLGVGQGPIVAPEQAVVIERDPELARSVARSHLDPYLARENYLRNWRRLGFTEADFEAGGSDRLVDALVAWGSEDEVAERVSAHLSAGADHVAVQVLHQESPGVHDIDWESLGSALESAVMDR